jgi:hypothetical protein
MRYTLYLLATALLFLINCDNDPTSSPTVVTTETWKIVDSDDPLSKADLTFNSLSNSTVSVSGKWTYIFWEETVTCTFLTGSATVNDTSVSINVKGTASYPPDSTGYVESSPFTLIMTGGFNKGKASGTWEISFTKEDWMDWGTDGAFTGTLQQGNGITK